jgi:large subunit ribosomal protein L19
MDSGLPAGPASLKLFHNLEKAVAKRTEPTIFPAPPARASLAISPERPTSKEHAMSTIIDKIDQEQLKKEVAPFSVGDTVKVHTRVVEGEKERIQIFAGIIISHKGTGLNEAFTVRKISYGEGVERVFPVHSPKVAKIEVTKRGKVRRSRLHYLRGRIGKSAMAVKEIDTARSKKS